LGGEKIGNTKAIGGLNASLGNKLVEPWTIEV
jgi:hypothetical protein